MSNRDQIETMLSNGVQSLASRLCDGEQLVSLWRTIARVEYGRDATLWEIAYDLAAVHLRFHGPFAIPRCTASPCELEGLSLGVLELVHACFLLNHEFFPELKADWAKTKKPTAAAGVPYYSYALQQECSSTGGRRPTAVIRAATQQLRSAGVQINRIPLLLPDGQGRGELHRVKSRLRTPDVRTFRSHSGIGPATSWPGSTEDKKEIAPIFFFIP